MEEMPILQSINNSDDTITLDEAEQKLCMLLSKGEDNAWETGDLLNCIEKRGLVFGGELGRPMAQAVALVTSSLATFLYRTVRSVSEYFAKSSSTATRSLP